MNVLLLFLTGAMFMAKPSELIVGKWQSTDAKKGTIEFFQDGKVLLGGTLSAKYRFIDDDNIEVELKVPGTDQTGTKRVRVKITANDMTATDRDGTTKYQRVR